MYTEHMKWTHKFQWNRWWRMERTERVLRTHTLTHTSLWMITMIDDIILWCKHCRSWIYWQRNWNSNSINVRCDAPVHPRARRKTEWMLISLQFMKFNCWKCLDKFAFHYNWLVMRLLNQTSSKKTHTSPDELTELIKTKCHDFTKTEK